MQTGRQSKLKQGVAHAQAHDVRHALNNESDPWRNQRHMHACARRHWQVNADTEGRNILIGPKAELTIGLPALVSWLLNSTMHWTYSHLSACISRKYSFTELHSGYELKLKL